MIGSTLYIRKKHDADGSQRFILQERLHDIGGLDFNDLANLTHLQACALVSFAPWIRSNVKFDELYSPNIVMDIIRIERAPEREVKTPSFRVRLGNAEPLLCGIVLAEILHNEAKIPYENKKSLEQHARLDELEDEKSDLQRQMVALQDAMKRNEREQAFVKAQIETRKDSHIHKREANEAQPELAH